MLKGAYISKDGNIPSAFDCSVMAKKRKGSNVPEINNSSSSSSNTTVKTPQLSILGELLDQAKTSNLLALTRTFPGVIDLTGATQTGVPSQPASNTVPITTGTGTSVDNITAASAVDAEGPLKILMECRIDALAAKYTLDSDIITSIDKSALETQQKLAAMDK